MLSVWLIAAYEPLQPVSSRAQAALFGPLQRFQFRDSFAWVGESRPALLERYRDFADYQKQYLAAAEELVAARYMLEEDLPRLKALCDKFRGDFEVK